jgi:hypothetical protein
VPLTPLQRQVVRTLREYRSKHDYVGGGAALNQRWPRLSDDMDIFEDHDLLPSGPTPELEALRVAGFSVEVTTHNEWMVEAIVRQYGFETRIQWIHDAETSRRFFPAMVDEELGFRLHPADAAVNKVLCAARRNTAPRDTVDLASIVSRYSPLGPLVWALPGKDLRLNPPTAISNIRRIAFGYADEEIKAVRMEEGAGMTRQDIRAILDEALTAAAVYCEEIAPDDYLGCLFVDANDTPVEATAITIEDGSHRPIAISDYGRLPRLEEESGAVNR